MAKTLADEIGTMDPERMRQWEQACQWTHIYAAKIGATDAETILEATDRVIAERDALRARVAELETAVRTLHALAESHFGEGTIDVPALGL